MKIPKHRATNYLLTIIAKKKFWKMEYKLFRNFKIFEIFQKVLLPSIEKQTIIILNKKAKRFYEKWLRNYFAILNQQGIFFKYPNYFISKALGSQRGKLPFIQRIKSMQIIFQKINEFYHENYLTRKVIGYPSQISNKSFFNK